MIPIIAFSGGKDSVATIGRVLDLGWKKPEIVFCDTGWEHPLTYQYVKEIENHFGIPIKWIHSDKYSGFIDMVIQRKRFPSTMARFCTQTLKVEPMIDYILDVIKQDFIIFQGMRKDESLSRSKKQPNCTYFKYYLEPYGKDSKGSDRYHTYRKDDVLAFVDNYVHDVQRPVFDWTANMIFEYLIKMGIPINPLYKMNMKRVGCFPCINVNLDELWNIYIRFPERLYEIADYEDQLGTTFFTPDFIPNRYCTKHVVVKKDLVTRKKRKVSDNELFAMDEYVEIKNYSDEEIDFLVSTYNAVVENGKITIDMYVPTTRDVIRYLEDKHANGETLLGDKPKAVTSCDSIYQICE